MSSFRSFLVIFLVTVFGSCRHTLCAHTFNDSSSEINWSSSAYQPVNNDRQVRQSSSSGGSFSSNSANIVNHRIIENSQSVAPSPSTVSIVPSYSYQFHTNDHEHLDRIVGSHHQNSFTNSFSSAPSHSVSGSGSSISNKISNVPGADNELSGSTRVESVSPGHKRDTAAASHLPNFSNQQKQQNQAYYSAPASELKPSYQYQVQVPKQQEKIASWTLNSQRMGGNWEGKQKQQQQPAQSHQFQLLQQSVPPANPSYLSQKAQHTVTTSTQQQNPNPSWTGPSTLARGGKNSVIRNNSSSAFVYSHPLKTPQNDNKNPISSQTRHQQQPVQYQTRFFLSKANPELATTVPYSTPQTPRSMPSIQQRLSTVKNERKKKTNGKRKILSRADSYSDDEEQYLPDDDEQDDDGNEMMPYDGSEGDHNEYYYGGQDAQLRDVPGFGGPFVGGPQFPPGPPVLPPPGPALPPPPPLKGSVDYILIPLILIGLAGPIFVVLYVVLGAFEYRIAPVTRSLKSSFADYQPYLDSITSSVGRALEKYECLDYATCHIRGYYNGLGLSSNTSSTIESTLSSVTPKEYLPSLRSVFSILKNPEVENCHKYKCSNMVDEIPRSFKNYF